MAIRGVISAPSAISPRRFRSCCPTPSRRSDRALHLWMDERILPLARQSEADQQRAITTSWRELGGTERFVFNKLITGGFRVGVSQQLVVRALARASRRSTKASIAHRLTGHWTPSAAFFTGSCRRARRATPTSRVRIRSFSPIRSRPTLESLGEPGEWQAEWKWDGIRSQLIRRDGQTFIWSRGEELVTDRFPEIAGAADFLPDGTVIDGEIMPWRDGAPLPFAQLQRRIGRKTLGAKILAEVPVVLIAYDLLELDGRDLRDEPLVDAASRARDVVVADARSPAIDRCRPSSQLALVGRTPAPHTPTPAR